MRVLVTGGAGYIGAHVVKLLVDGGDTPLVVDDLSAGQRSRLGGVPLEELDLLAPDAAPRLESIMRESGIDSVIHFAALKAAGESVEQPLRYYRHNIDSLLTVLTAMQRAAVPQLVFSSSAAVYGDAPSPLTEDTPPLPVNPYGETKLIGEWLVAAAAAAHGLSATSLRYFNVAGAAEPRLGDTSANNLIPQVIERIRAGKPPLIYGDDYGTPDGTCIRDYIHVSDIAAAHVLALRGIRPGHRVYNVGTGTGTSVREVIDRVLEVSGSETRPEVVARRPGDPEVVVADASRIHGELGFTARHTIHDIVESAWRARARGH